MIRPIGHCSQTRVMSIASVVGACRSSMRPLLGGVLRPGRAAARSSGSSWARPNCLQRSTFRRSRQAATARSRGGYRDVIAHRRTGNLPVGSRLGYRRNMTPDEIADLAHLRRARDLMDRDYAQPLDVPAMARIALMSPAHFSRKFRTAYGETPYSYLMTRRIERAKALLRQGMSVTDTCVAVGCTSLGSFSARFTEIVGETPSRYRAHDHHELQAVPACVSMVGTRPRRTPAGRAGSEKH